ncbi:MAG: hypothetical protein IKK67_01550 [Bacteroidaceae bacterium]|nr:hypothetical protein [Bacteroidaceae bacterium]
MIRSSLTFNKKDYLNLLLQKYKGQIIDEDVLKEIIKEILLLSKKSRPHIPIIHMQTPALICGLLQAPITISLYDLKEIKRIVGLEIAGKTKNIHTNEHYEHRERKDRRISTDRRTGR